MDEMKAPESAEKSVVKGTVGAGLGAGAAYVGTAAAAGVLGYVGLGAAAAAVVGAAPVVIAGGLLYGAYRGAKALFD